jgi:membrane protein YdbS with pleckstrin-like domain
MLILMLIIMLIMIWTLILIFMLLILKMLKSFRSLSSESSEQAAANRKGSLWHQQRSNESSSDKSNYSAKEQHLNNV